MKVRFLTKRLPKPLSYYINKKKTGCSDKGLANLSSDGKVWTTAHSKFKYKMIDSKSELDETLWEYSGAKAGFLTQSLLPPLKLIQVLEVDGTYGKFISKNGSDPLNEYDACKDSAGPRHFAHIYDVLEQLNVFAPDKSECSWFVKSVYERCFSAGEESGDVDFLNSPKVKHLYHSLVSRKQLPVGVVYMGQEKTPSSRDITLAEFCRIVGSLRVRTNKFRLGSL